MTDLKANPTPDPGFTHDFDCTHDPCLCEARRYDVFAPVRAAFDGLDQARIHLGERVGRMGTEVSDLRARLVEAETVMREVLDTYGDYEEFDPLRRFLGLPLYDSTESWQARGEALAPALPETEGREKR